LPHSVEHILLPCLQGHAPHRHRPSFPTRRSSDLTSSTSSLCGESRAGRRRAGGGWCSSSTSSVFRSRSRTAVRTRRDQNLPRSRSEEHTSELQSREKLVCRLLLEKKNTDERERTG